MARFEGNCREFRGFWCAVWWGMISEILRARGGRARRGRANGQEKIERLLNCSFDPSPSGYLIMKRSPLLSGICAQRESAASDRLYYVNYEVLRAKDLRHSENESENGRGTWWNSRYLRNQRRYQESFSLRG